MTITRSGWTTIMVDSCKPLIATATSLYTIGSATAVYNGSHLVFSATREVDGAGFVAQVAAGIDNSFEFNVSKLASSSDEGVLVTVLETIDNVPYVIGGGRLQLGPKQRINFRSTGNNVSLLFTGPFNMVELSQVCTKYPKSVQHTYLVDVCDEDKDRYRFGFNGQEKVNEIAGVGNHLDFKFRGYDSRIGRFWSVDPLAYKNVSWTPYVFCANNPIIFIDPDGRDWILSTGNKVYWYGGKYGDKSNLLATYKATSGMNSATKTTTLPNGSTKKETVNTQQAKYQRYSSVGPTPEGKYRINLKPDPDRVAEADTRTGDLKRNPNGGIEKIPNFVENPKKPGYGWTYSDWGKNRARMEPVNVTGATSEERDLNSFYLHDSQKGYSHGCTEVEEALFEKLKEYRDAGNSSIEIKVDYPNENHKTNGGTKATPQKTSGGN